MKDAETNLCLVELAVTKSEHLMQQAKLKMREQKAEQNS